MAMPVLVPYNDDDLEFSEFDLDEDMIPLFGFPDPDGSFSDQWLDAWVDQILNYMDWEDFMGLSYFVITGGNKDERGMLLGYDFDLINADIDWRDHRKIKAETVPVPAPVLLLGSGIAVLAGLQTRKTEKGV
jgi:hypothetical protein